MDLHSVPCERQPGLALNDGETRVRACQSLHVASCLKPLYLKPQPQLSVHLLEMDDLLSCLLP